MVNIPEELTPKEQGVWDALIEDLGAGYKRINVASVARSQVLVKVDKLLKAQPLIEKRAREKLIKELDAYLDCPIRKADGILYYMFHIPKEKWQALKGGK